MEKTEAFQLEEEEWLGRAGFGMSRSGHLLNCSMPANSVSICRRGPRIAQLRNAYLSAVQLLKEMGSGRAEAASGTGFCRLETEYLQSAADKAKLSSGGGGMEDVRSPNLVPIWTLVSAKVHATIRRVNCMPIQSLFPHGKCHNADVKPFVATIVASFFLKTAGLRRKTAPCEISGSISHSPTTAEHLPRGSTLGCFHLQFVCRMYVASSFGVQSGDTSVDDIEAGHVPEDLEL